MINYEFEYERPDTLEEAVALTAESGTDTRLLAGGTDLLPNIRVEVYSPRLLISLGAIEATPPETMPDASIRIDALTRLNDLANSEFLRHELPMLAKSAYVVGSNQIRQVGTLAGNLCQENRCLYMNQRHDFQFVKACYKRGGDCCYPFPGNTPDSCWSVYMSDIAPALIAMAAEIEILDTTSTRRIPVAKLFTGNGMIPLALRRSELIRYIFVPGLKPGFGWGYNKSTVRGGLEFATTIIAVTLQLDKDGKTCTSVRVVFGAIGEGPIRPINTEKALIGMVLDEETISQAAIDASQEINPMPHHGFTRSYLKSNIRVYLRRTLTNAFERARQAVK